jgi:hypothetical protein
MTSSLFNKEKYSDVWCVAGEDMDKSIPCHKLILVSRSTYFATMYVIRSRFSLTLPRLQSGMVESKTNVIGISLDVLFVDFLFSS